MIGPGMRVDHSEEGGTKVPNHPAVACGEEVLQQVAKLVGVRLARLIQFGMGLVQIRDQLFEIVEFPNHR